MPQHMDLDLDHDSFAHLSESPSGVVNARPQDKGIKGTADCAVGGKEEAHAHRLKPCPYLDIPFQMARELYTQSLSVCLPASVCLSVSVA